MRPDMREYIEPLPVQNDASFTKEIRRIQSDVVRFFLSARGFGDTITGLYAACGLADAGHAVEFFTPRPELLNVTHPGLTIIKGEEGFDANTNYRVQLHESRDGGTRCDWYLKNIAEAYAIEQVKASRPKEIGKFKAPMGGDYVLLCPFSVSEARTWAAAHWRRLTLMLQKAGHTVVAIAANKHRTQCEELFYGLGVKQFIETDTETMCGLIAHAKCVVSNDSGPAHIGGLYGKKTVAIISTFRPDYLYECAENLTAVTPDDGCRFCHETVEGGWDQFCLGQCSRLQLVSPERVYAAIVGQGEPDIKDIAKTVLLKRKRK